MNQEILINIESLCCTPEANIMYDQLHRKKHKNKPGVADFANSQPTKMAEDTQIKRCVFGKHSLEKKSYCIAFCSNFRKIKRSVYSLTQTSLRDQRCDSQIPSAFKQKLKIEMGLSRQDL